jgi:hypothetical protein
MLISLAVYLLKKMGVFICRIRERSSLPYLVCLHSSHQKLQQVNTGVEYNLACHDPFHGIRISWYPSAILCFSMRYPSSLISVIFYIPFRNIPKLTPYQPGYKWTLFDSQNAHWYLFRCFPCRVYLLGHYRSRGALYSQRLIRSRCCIKNNRS